MILFNVGKASSKAFFKQNASKERIMVGTVTKNANTVT